MLICKKCGDVFPIHNVINGVSHNLNNRKYCLTCSPFGLHNTKKLHEKSKDCKQCGKAGIERTYCSSLCHGKWVFNQRVALVRKNGKINLPCTSQTARKIMFAIRKRKCTVCNRRTWLGKEIPLVLDHISGDSTDWTLKNLRFLCPNCDAQTDTYKGRNKGNGRHIRRVRYQEGKSF